MIFLQIGLSVRLSRGGNILKYNDIKGKIEKNIIDTVYLFLGEEKYLKQEIINLLKKKIITTSFSNDFNFNHFYSYDIELGRIVDVCNTLPVFSEKRMVVVDDIDNYKSLKILENYISSPSINTVLILNTNERHFKQLQNKKKNIETVTFYNLFDNHLLQWIMDKCRQNNKNISQEAGQKLIYLCNNSLLEINNEVEKLLIYCKNRKMITIEDVEKLIGDVKGYDVYKLIDAILSSQYQLSLRLFKKLFESSKNAYSFFALLSKSLHLIFHIKYLLEKERLKPGEIIKKLSIAPYRYKKIIANIRKYNLNQISKIIMILFKFDYKFKSYSAVNKQRLFEDLIYRLKAK